VIGRLYTWRGAVWLLVVRAEPFVAAPGMGPMRNVLIERVEPYPEVMRPRGNPRRHEGDLWWHTGERVVRPFRGLRLWRP
jgi:hypothetical protein